MKRNLYIDEKGPQENIDYKSANELSINPHDRFKIGDDNMIDYVMAVVDIPSDKNDCYNEKFFNNEIEYKKTSKKFNDNKELKGALLLKKNFDYGIASMHDKQIQYYLKLIKILKKYDAKTCVIVENKVESIISGRLRYWILNVSAKNDISPTNIMYVLSKYLTLEAPSSVIELFYNKKNNLKDILKKILKDMHKFIKKNKDISRMYNQINAYEQISKIIEENLDVNVIDPKESGAFEWNKINYDISLWTDERKYNGEKNQYILFLDNGIQNENVDYGQFKDIKVDCDSKKFAGIRSADLIATIIGKMISKLNIATLYDKNNPDKIKKLDDNWFDLDDNQIELIKELKHLLMDNYKYSFLNGNYYDDALSLQSYLKYISQFDNKKQLREYANPDDELAFALEEMKQKNKDILYNNFIISDFLHKHNSTYEKFIEDGILKPI